MDQRPPEWDASTYHRIADPHTDWGARVLDRLPLRGDELVVDAGCGTGRVTALLLERLPDGMVIGVDRSANMLREAAAWLKPRYKNRVSFVQADLLKLRLRGQVDAVFSTATFHWIPDHPALFANLHRHLKPGGWLVAQCGGGPVLARLRARAEALMRSAPYQAYFEGWAGPWNFADDRLTGQRLEEAGFVEVETTLQETPLVLEDANAYRDYLRTVIFGVHLDRIPEDALRHQFVEALTRQAASDDPPYLLDYWRLNMRARRSIDPMIESLD
jgi:trans-aconitate methyltransferase